MELTNNGLTTQSSSLISEFTVKCKVKELVIGCNSTIGEYQQLYTMLIDPSNTLEELHMVDNKLPHSGLISRGEIFVDWIVKTFRGYIFKDYN